MDKIKYQCKNCGWETTIRSEWGDLRPKRCMNKKCNTSFTKNRESLITTHPEPKVSPIVVVQEKQERSHGKTSRRSQKSSDTVE